MELQESPHPIICKSSKIALRLLRSADTPQSATAVLTVTNASNSIDITTTTYYPTAYYKLCPLSLSSTHSLLITWRQRTPLCTHTALRPNRVNSTSFLVHYTILTWRCICCIHLYYLFLPSLSFFFFASLVTLLVYLWDRSCRCLTMKDTAFCGAWGQLQGDLLYWCYKRMQVLREGLGINIYKTSFLIELQPVQMRGEKRQMSCYPRRHERLGFVASRKDE